MILTLAVWLIVLNAAAGYGRLLTPYSLDGRRAESDASRVYAGLLIVSTILLLVALFTNLTPWIGVVALLPGLAVYWRRRPLGKLFRRSHVIYVLIALFVSVHEINFYDTALYHQQAVKWLAEHGLVRGLALVYFPFGFVDSWFAFAAPLDHGITAGRVGIIGGLPFALAVVPAIRIGRGLFDRRMVPRLSSLTWAILGLLLAVVSIEWHVDSSLSPDSMIWLLPMIIITVLTSSEAAEADRLGRATVVAAMACLIKSTAAPALAYCFVLMAWRFVCVAQDRRKLAMFGALAVCILSILLAASLIASGCPLFPSSFGCTSLGWSVGADGARSAQALIGEFARTPRHDQIFPLIAAVVIASLLLIAADRTERSRHILAISWLGIIFVLIAAPNPRYGLGYFLLPIAALVAVLLQRVVAALTWPPLPRSVGASAVLGAAAGVAIFAAAALDPVSLLYPRRIASANGEPIHVVNRVVDARGILDVHEEQRGELTIWSPLSSDQCWDAPLPCTPNQTRSGLRLRRNGTLDAGFQTF